MGDLNPEVTTTGSVVYNGHNIYSPRTDTVELRKEIGMVFQQPNPFPMTIYENVVYGLRINGIKDKQVLDEAVEKPCKVPLSGMRSRIVYMIQLLDCQVVNSSVSAWPVSWQLVLKSSSWMSQLRLWIRFQLVKLRKPLYGLKDKYTMLLVTRSMQQASRISDKTGFFLDGDLIEFNDTKQMFLDPQHKETEDYITGKFG